LATSDWCPNEEEKNKSVPAPKEEEKMTQARDSSTRDSSTDSASSHTFNLQRIHPMAHRLQQLETEQLLTACRQIRGTASKEEMELYMRSPTTYVRRWARWHVGHRTWREELQLYGALVHDDDDNKPVSSEHCEGTHVRQIPGTPIIISVSGFDDVDDDNKPVSYLKDSDDTLRLSQLNMYNFTSPPNLESEDLVPLSMIAEMYNLKRGRNPQREDEQPEMEPRTQGAAP